MVRSQFFKYHQAIGDPIPTIKRLSDWSVDELFLLNIGDSKIVDYSIPIPTGLIGELELTARLRFRSFPPFYLRHLGLEDLIENVNIFDIDVISDTTYVLSN